MIKYPQTGHIVSVFLSFYGWRQWLEARLRKLLWKTTGFDSFHYAAMFNNEHAVNTAGQTSKILNIYVLTVIRLPHGTNIFSVSLCFIAISCKRNCYLILSWKWNSAKREALTKQFLALTFRPTPAIRTLYSLAKSDFALGFFRVKSMLVFLVTVGERLHPCVWNCSVKQAKKRITWSPGLWKNKTT